MSDEGVISDLLFDDITSEIEKKPEILENDIFSAPFEEKETQKDRYKGDLIFDEVPISKNESPEKNELIKAEKPSVKKKTEKPLSSKVITKEETKKQDTDDIFSLPIEAEKPVEKIKGDILFEETPKKSVKKTTGEPLKSNKKTEKKDGESKTPKASEAKKKTEAEKPADKKPVAKKPADKKTAQKKAQQTKNPAAKKAVKNDTSVKKQISSKKSVEVKLAEGKKLTKSEKESLETAPKVKSGAISTAPKDLPAFFEKDEKGRDLLPDTFYFNLRFSNNQVKYLYSRVKNTLLSYRGMKGIWKKDCEEFKFGSETLFRIALSVTEKGEALEVCFALNPGDISLEIYKYEKIVGKWAETTPLKILVRSYAALKRASDLIELVNTNHKNVLLLHYTPTAFAEALNFPKDSVIVGKESWLDRGAGIGKDYKNITDDLSQAIIQKATGRKKSTLEAAEGSDRLKKQRDTGKKIKKSVAETQPIIYFYDACVGFKGAIEYVNIQQVLHDRFIGKMLPQQFFAVAEGSDRIEFLNFLSLKRAVEDCNANPDLKFVLNVSCRLLIYSRTLERLIEESKTENNNLILSFDCALLEALGTVGIAAISAIKAAGVMVMIDNAESTTMRVLTEYEFDYLRLDARWYNENNAKKTAHLDMMVGYSSVQGITMTAMYVNTPRLGQFFIKHGITAVQGMAVSRPMRLIRLMVNSVKPL